MVASENKFQLSRAVRNIIIRVRVRKFRLFDTQMPNSFEVISRAITAYPSIKVDGQYKLYSNAI